MAKGGSTNKKSGDVSAELLDVHNRDARELGAVVPRNSVNVTVTSPPYFDLKDYGSKKQIGFGQEYDVYLRDLQSVFKSVHDVTVEDGSLWIIIDTFKRGNELLPLPFDLSNKLKEVGWALQDVIIWKKERTVPWVAHGATRNIFEYILVFSKKGAKHRYYQDRLRDVEDLKHWWVKYPERYNPKGKALEEIWTFDIPTQGSWGNGYIDHFCPLPEGLVQQILELTTNEGDVVLDPFSGSGTVPAQARFMQRQYIGFELNKKYISDFKKYVKKNEDIKTAEYQSRKNKPNVEEFEKRILRLRVLKYGRLMLRELIKKFPQIDFVLFADFKASTSSQKHKVSGGSYYFYVSSEKFHSKINAAISELGAIKPLSKFGIEAEVQLESDWKKFQSRAKKSMPLFGYTLQNSHKYQKQVGALTDSLKIPKILSPIEAFFNESDYK